jgi:hypothetical protein
MHLYRGIFMEEHILRVFENRVLRRIFRPRREEEAGSCIISTLWGDQIKGMRWAHVFGKREEKRPPGRHRHRRRWEEWILGK